MALPPPRPRDSPTELERERLGRGDGAVEEKKQQREVSTTRENEKCFCLNVGEY